MDNTAHTQLKHYWLYTLQLEQDKYYVGITSQKNPSNRITQHFNGFYTAEWVRKFKPVKQIELIDLGLIPNSDTKTMENQKTLEYMQKYGYQNARGGAFNYSGRYYRIGKQYFSDKTVDFTIGMTLIIISFLVVTIIALK